MAAERSISDKIKYIFIRLVFFCNFRSLLEIETAWIGCRESNVVSSSVDTKWNAFINASQHGENLIFKVTRINCLVPTNLVNKFHSIKGDEIKNRRVSEHAAWNDSLPPTNRPTGRWRWSNCSWWPNVNTRSYQIQFECYFYRSPKKC